MKKKTFSKLNFTLVFSLLCLMIVFILSCNRSDDIIDLGNNAFVKENFKVNYLKTSEIPDLMDFINRNRSSDLFKTTDLKNGAIFDVNNVMEVIDTLSFKNYSFHFTFPDTPQGTFYNLVAGEDSNGNRVDPFVLKFVSNDDSINEFVENGNNFAHFNGKVSFYKYTDFFEDGTFNKSSTLCPQSFDQYGDPIPCTTETASGGGSTSGGGDGGSGTSSGTPSGTTGSNTTSSGGGGVEYYCIMNVRYWSCDWIMLPKANYQKMALDAKMATGDCPECNTNPDGGIGINTGSLKPCPQNPLPNIELAHQLGPSGWKGGMYGNSNSSGG